MARHQMISMDPLEHQAALTGQLYLHGPVIIDPVSGAFFVTQDDATVPLPDGELRLSRTWKAIPGSTESPGFVTDLGPGSPWCREGASCDAEGRVLSWFVEDNRLDVRREQGRPVDVILRERALVTMAWDAEGRMARLVTSTGFVRTFEWNSDGTLRSTFDGTGTTRYTYDGRKRLTGIERAGESTSWTYDPLGRVLRIEGPGGATSRLRWESVQGILRCDITDPVGARTLYEWNPAIGTLAVTNALGGKTILTRNARGQTTEVVAPDSTVTKLKYDDHGRLTHLDSPGGVRQHLVWHQGTLTEVREKNRTAVVRLDETGRLAEVAAGPEHRLVITRDPSGRIRRMDLPGNRSLSFTWDSLGPLVRLADQDGFAQERTYDGNGLLVSQSNTAGHKRTFSYDTSGHLERIDHPDGTSESWSWNSSNRIRSYGDRTGTQTSLSYDTGGRVSSVRRGTAEEVSFERDPLGRIVREKSSRGIRRMAYDLLGHLQTVRREDGIQEEFQWSMTGSLTTHVVGGRTVWTGRYDSRGLLVEETIPPDRTRTIEYDALKRVTKLSDGVQTIQVTWDPDGSARFRDDDAKVTWQLRPTGWDGVLRVVDITSDSGTRRQWTYSAAGEPLSRQDTHGETITWTYGPDGSPVQVDSTLSGRIQMAVDVSGRLTRLTSNSDATRTWRYDDRGRMVEAKIGTSGWVYTYDAAHRLASATNPSGQTTQFFWNPRGLLASRTLPSGNTEFLEYDDLGQLALRHLPDGTSDSFQWDDWGRFTAWHRDGVLLRQVQYSPAGRVILDEGLTHRIRTAASAKETRIETTNETLDRSAIRTFDSAGRLLTLEVPGIGSVSCQRGTGGTLDTLTFSNGRKMTFVRDGSGRKTQVSLPGGGQVNHSYTDVGQVKSIDITSASGARVFVSFEYDATGRLKKKSLGSHNLQYGYDGAGRIAWFEHAGSPRLSYEFDASGNLVRAGATTIARGVLDEPLGTPDATRVFSRTGAIESLTTPSGTRRFEYDQARRLSAVAMADGSRVEYTYDGTGYLQTRTVRTADGGILEAQQFLYADSSLVAQVTADRIAQLHVPGDAPGERLAVVTAQGALFVVQGPDGSTLALVDEAGNAQALFVHAPFGTLLGEKETNADPFHFQGQFTDAVTGYIHFPLRWADPRSFSFLAPDPDAGTLALPESQNRYAFLANDPVNRVDPLGAEAYVWDATRMTLEGVCDMFQKGQVQAGRAFGSALDGFDYAGSIDKRGWSYDVWVKRIPGTNQVSTIIRDLNQRADGPFGKSNLTGNLVLRDTPTVAQPVTQTVSQAASQPPAAQGPGLARSIGDSIRNTTDSVKHGVQVYGKEISTTVAGLGGVSGTLGTSVGTIAALPGGAAIIGIGVAVAGALGYGTGTLINMIPGVADGTQSFVSKVMGYEQNQTMANITAEQDNRGERAKEIEKQRIEDNMKKFAASGMPLSDTPPAVAGASRDLGGPPPEPTVPQGVASDPTSTSGEAAAKVESSRRRTSSTSEETESGAAQPPDEPRKGDDDGEDDEGEDEEGSGNRSEDDEEEHHEPETAPPDNRTPLERITPQQVSVPFENEEDFSAGEFKNIVTCRFVVTFWNVGALVPGYGGAIIRGTCTASLNGASAAMNATGTFSGGPNGTITFSADGDMGGTIQLNNGQTATMEGVGTRPLSNPGAFANWP